MSDSDLEKVGGEVDRQLTGMERAAGSYLPAELVETQASLVALGPSELARRLADLVIAAALAGYAASPRLVLEELLDGYPITDESWYSRVGPELRRLMTERGITVKLVGQ